GITGERAQQPLAPARRLLVVLTDEQGFERQGCVAHPAIPVVPVPRAAESLRQRGGGRGDDPARRRERERLEGEERADHRLAPRAAVVRAARGPTRPTAHG